MIPFRLPSLPKIAFGWKIKLALTLFAFASAFFAGWTVNGWRWKAKDAERERRAAVAIQRATDAVRAQESRNAQVGQDVAGAVERGMAAIAGRRDTRTKEIHYVTQDKAYRCLITDDGLRLYNSGVQAANVYTASFDNASEAVTAPNE